MCSSRGKTELSAKDMKVLGVIQADALAFFALQSTKPEFMLTKEACPSHKEVCSIFFVMVPLSSSSLPWYVALSLQGILASSNGSSEVVHHGQG